MNIVLWTLQFFLAFHTLSGAVWKMFNPVETVPTLAALSQFGWMTLAGMEILCTVLLVLPMFRRRFMGLAIFASLLITVEMVIFSVTHAVSLSPDYSPVIYWLIVAAMAAFLAYARIRRADLPT